MNEHRDKPYIKWGLTALVVIFISILLVVIFTNLPGFFGVLTALETILEPLIFGVVIAFLLNPIVRFVDSRLLPLLEQAAKALPPRLLVRTYERMPVDRWDDQLAAFAPETVERLADLGVLLIGIDSASIDPADSKTLDSHQVIRQRGLRVLENLVLDEVPEGDYELIALPLKLSTADASPVRAVLRAL